MFDGLASAGLDAKVVGVKPTRTGVRVRLELSPAGEPGSGFPYGVYADGSVAYAGGGLFVASHRTSVGPVLPVERFEGFSDDRLRGVVRVETRGVTGALLRGDAAVARLAGGALRDARETLLARGVGVPPGADVALRALDRFAASTSDLVKE